MESTYVNRAHTGLTNSEVLKSRKQSGSNDISRKERDSFFKQYLGSFNDPIIRILLVALLINIIFMFRDFNWMESVGIAAAVFLATFLATLSEYGSGAAFDKLQEETERIKCRVKRSDGVFLLPVSEVVVGDLVLLQQGEKVPADGIIISGELSVDQSALNGESEEARKFPAAGTGASDASGFMSKGNMFRGSVICSGSGVMLVQSVGNDTFYGKLAVEIQEDEGESPLKSRLRELAKQISWFGYLAAAVVFFGQLFNNIVLANGFNTTLMLTYLGDLHTVFGDVLQALTLAVTVIVMAVPEGLPMMISIVLSSSMRRMMKDNVLVRKLVGIETAGSLNLLFTDKTGTLTQGRLTVTSFVSGTGKEYTADELKGKKELYTLCMLNCVFNSQSQIGLVGKHSAPIGGNATEKALLQFVMNDAHRLPEYHTREFTAFDSNSKFSAVKIMGDRQMYLIKGAPEKLLPSCTHIYNEGGNRTLFADRQKIAAAVRDMAQRSIRVLALCTGDTPVADGKPGNMTLIGLIGIRDNVRPQARKAIQEVTSAGVQVVMITGDNRDTAVAIAREVGLISNDTPNNVCTSADLATFSDEELKRRLPNIKVVARALPSDKSRLVRLGKEMGQVVGMTGDGVNDAPALKKADVGFAMGSGTEVAKEAGDIVIVDDNFSSMSKAILYGRTTFKSIRKFIIFQLTINVCAVGVSVIGPFIGVEMPITIIQMLWINMIMDTLAGLAFSGEAPLPEYMKEPPKRRDEAIITPYMFTEIAFTGIYTLILCLVFLKLPLFHQLIRPSHDDIYFMTAFFGLFIFAGIFNSLNARTSRINLLAKIGSNHSFVIIMLMVACTQLAMIFFGGTLFRTAPLNTFELSLILLMAFSVIPVDLLRKSILKRIGFRGTV